MKKGKRNSLGRQIWFFKQKETSPLTILMHMDFKRKYKKGAIQITPACCTQMKKNTNVSNR